jgi:hypothetical protein
MPRCSEHPWTRWILNRRAAVASIAKSLHIGSNLVMTARAEIFVEKEGYDFPDPEQVLSTLVPRFAGILAPEGRDERESECTATMQSSVSSPANKPPSIHPCNTPAALLRLTLAWNNSKQLHTGAVHEVHHTNSESHCRLQSIRVSIGGTAANTHSHTYPSISSRPLHSRRDTTRPTPPPWPVSVVDTLQAYLPT